MFLPLFIIWIALELIFYVRLNLHLLPRISKLTNPAEYPQHPELIFRQMMDRLEILVGEGQYCWKRFFSWWLQGAPFESIHHDNLFEWFAWSMFVCKTEDLNESQKRSVRNIVKLVEKKLNYKFPVGYNPSVKAVRFTIEPMKTFYRPLLVYMIILAVKISGDIFLYLNGFRWYTTTSFGYWYRPGPKNQVNKKEEPLPMVYFHGLATGIVLCLRLILRLSKGRAAFLIQMKYITPTLTFEAVGHSELPRQTKQILKKHGHSKCCVVGHSFGTVCSGWLIKYTPEIVGQAVFLDPVCFFLWLPDICYNFL